VPKLSKSKLQSFFQCPKKLWLELYRSDLQETDDMAKLIFERGSAFGAAIRECFSDGISFDKLSIAEALEQTRNWMQSFDAGNERVPLFEAAFTFNNIIIRADVLEPTVDGKWKLIEVKSSVSKDGVAPRHEYVRDAAIQAYVLENCKVSLESIEIGQPNRDFILPPNADINGILIRVDITILARSIASELEKFVTIAMRVANSGDEPSRETGGWCNKPHQCGFLRHCSGATLMADEKIIIPVWELGGTPTTKVVSFLMEAGHRDLAGVPAAHIKKPMHKVMHAIARGADPYVDPKLIAHLRDQPFPRYFLDFETNNAPLPLWYGTRPSERVEFQFSLDKWTTENGPIEHVDFLGETFDDPRPALARRLAEAMEEPGPVFAWNGNSTEGPITEGLVRYLPEKREILKRVADSCKENDPVKIFRETFYHPAMKGSWGLKSIVKAMFDVSPYSSLVIANGVDAMRAYETFLKLPEGEARNKLRVDLFKYCNTDTRVMIQIWQKLLKKFDSTQTA